MENGSSNLTPTRGPNVWATGTGTAGDDTLTRAFLGAGGLGLLVMGLQRRSWANRVAAASGAVLLTVASTPGALDQLRSWIDRTRWRLTHHSDEVTDASALSFPASDSPAWTSTVGAGEPERTGSRH